MVLSKQMEIKKYEAKELITPSSSFLATIKEAKDFMTPSCLMEMKKEAKELITPSCLLDFK